METVVLAQILKLFALRPLLSMAIFGIPILTLIVIGLFAVAILKFLLVVALPLGLVYLFVRWMRRSAPAPHRAAET
jgi:hypothetical protein